MASQQGRRELGDRSVPLGYVAGRRATENDAGGHFQHPAKGPRQTTLSSPTSPENELTMNNTFFPISGEETKRDSPPPLSNPP